MMIYPKVGLTTLLLSSSLLFGVILTALAEEVDLHEGHMHRIRRSPMSVTEEVFEPCTEIPTDSTAAGGGGGGGGDRGGEETSTESSSSSTTSTDSSSTTQDDGDTQGGSDSKPKDPSSDTDSDTDGEQTDETTDMSSTTSSYTDGAEPFCLATECTSILNETKCGQDMEQFGQIQYGCQDDEAKFLCCSGMDTGALEASCLATECKSMLTKDVKCPELSTEMGTLEYGCPAQHAKYLCCFNGEDGELGGGGRASKYNDGEPKCLATQCKNEETTEGEKCSPHGPSWEPYGQVDYGCADDDTKFLCCQNMEPDAPDFQPTCFATVCTSNSSSSGEDVPKCPGNHEVIGDIQHGCPDDETRFLCCSTQPSSSSSLDNNGFLDGRGSGPSCMATDCKSVWTREDNCPNGMDVFGEGAQYGCPKDEAKFICCSGVDDVPDVDTSCIATECKEILSEEMKCPGMNEMGKIEHGCPSGEAKFICCDDDDSESDSSRGRGFGRKQSEIGHVDHDTFSPDELTCTATGCQSTLTKDDKCEFGMAEMTRVTYGCEDDEAKYICCHEPQGGSVCEATECKSKLSKEEKCGGGRKEMAQVEYGCERDQAKFICCSDLGGDSGNTDDGGRKDNQDNSKDWDQNVDVASFNNDPDDLPFNLRKEDLNNPSLATDCITTGCQNMWTKRIKCPGGKRQREHIRSGCGDNEAKFICCNGPNGPAIDDTDDYDLNPPREPQPYDPDDRIYRVNKTSQTIDSLTTDNGWKNGPDNSGPDNGPGGVGGLDGTPILVLNIDGRGGNVDESIGSSNSSISSDGSMSSGCISASYGNAKGRAKSEISNDPAGIRSSSSCKSSSGSKKRKNKRKSLNRNRGGGSGGRRGSGGRAEASAESGREPAYEY